MNDKLAVWIIDDDDISKYVLKRNLQELNVHNVKDFPDSIAPLEILKLNSADPQSLPDIIFLDINMPILDGFQFMEDYTLFNDKIDKKIKIYMLSSSMNTEDIARAKSNTNIMDYHVKPIPLERLKALIGVQ